MPDDDATANEVSAPPDLTLRHDRAARRQRRREDLGLRRAVQKKGRRSVIRRAPLPPDPLMEDERNEIRTDLLERAGFVIPRRSLLHPFRGRRR
jgi:hypothetical protein